MSRILAFSFVLLLAANALGQKVSASLDRAATSVGESVTLSITCTNFTPSSQPMLPSIRGLRFSSGGRRASFSLWSLGASGAPGTRGWLLLRGNPSRQVSRGGSVRGSVQGFRTPIHSH